MPCRSNVLSWWLAAISAVLLAAACGSESANPLAGPGTKPTASLSIVSGNNQPVPAGGQFPEPVRVQVNTSSAHLSTLNAILADPANTNWTAMVDVPASGIAEFRPTVGVVPGPYTLRIEYNWWGGNCGTPCVTLITFTSATGTIVP